MDRVKSTTKPTELLAGKEEQSKPSTVPGKASSMGDIDMGAKNSATELQDRKVDTEITIEAQVDSEKAVKDLLKLAETQHDSDLKEIGEGLGMLVAGKEVKEGFPEAVTGYVLKQGESLKENLDQLKKSDSQEPSEVKDEQYNLVEQIVMELGILKFLEDLVDYLTLKRYELVYSSIPAPFFGLLRLDAICYLLEKKEITESELSEYFISLNWILLRSPKKDFDSSHGNLIAQLLLKNFEKIKDPKNAIRLLYELATHNLIDDKEIGKRIAESLSSLLKHLKAMDVGVLDEIDLTYEILTNLLEIIDDKEVGKKIADDISNNLKNLKKSSPTHNNAYLALVYLSRNDLIDDKELEIRLTEDIWKYGINLNGKGSATTNYPTNAYMAAAYLLENSIRIDDKKIATKEADRILNEFNKLTDDNQKVYAYMSLFFLKQKNLIDDKNIENKVDKMLSNNLLPLVNELKKQLPDRLAWNALILLEKNGLISWKSLDEVLTKKKSDTRIGNFIATTILKKLPNDIDDVCWTLGTLIMNELIDPTTANKVAAKILEIWPKLSIEAQSSTVPVMAELITRNLVNEDIKKQIESLG